MIALYFARVNRLVNGVLVSVMRLSHTTHIRVEIVLRCNVFKVNRISLIDYILCSIGRCSNVMEIVWAILLEKLFEFRFDRQDILLQIEAPQAIDLAHISLNPIKGSTVYFEFLALIL